MQMQNQGKEIQRLKQSNKDLMAVIWKTKNERAKKGREVCRANNEVVQYQKRIAELEEQLKKSQNQKAIEELEKIYNLFEPYENSQKDTILCANNGISFIDYLENQIKSLKGEE